MGLSQFDETVPRVSQLVLNSGNGTTPATVWDWGTDVARVDAAFVSNNDVIPHVVDLILNNGSVATLLGSASVPAGAGYGGAPAVDVVAAVLVSALNGLPLGIGDFLQVGVEVAITAAFEVHVSMFGGLV